MDSRVKGQGQCGSRKQIPNGSVVNMASIVDMLFGCWHKNYSFPITNKSGQRRSPAASLTGTYVVCLDCGKEFPYDWKSMKVLDSRPRREKAMAANAADSRAA